MIPNILTTFALCAGFTALRFALEGRFEHAVGALVIAALFDAFDGRIARMLNQTSNFGAQLDTLSDFLCFGIVPATMLYMWTLNDIGLAGWALALVYCVCCALRLARFTAEIDGSERSAEARKYFIGIPSPVAAGLVLIPLVVSFHGKEGIGAFSDEPYLVGVFVVIVSGLMISQLPTFSLKQIRISHRYRVPTMLGVAIFAAAAVSEPWTTLTVLLVAYLLTLPLGWYSYRRLLEREAALQQVQETAPAEGGVALKIVEDSRK